MGVRNGFQFLIRMGLVPNLTGRIKQEVTLTRNAAVRFEDHRCYPKANSLSPKPFLQDIDIFNYLSDTERGKSSISKLWNKLIQEKDLYEYRKGN